MLAEAAAIGADTEPDYIDLLPGHAPSDTAAVYDALRDAIPEPHIRHDLAQILEQELGHCPTRTPNTLTATPTAAESANG